MPSSPGWTGDGMVRQASYKGIDRGQGSARGRARGRRAALTAEGGDGGLQARGGRRPGQRRRPREGVLRRRLRLPRGPRRHRQRPDPAHPADAARLRMLDLDRSRGSPMPRPAASAASSSSWWTSTARARADRVAAWTSGRSSTSRTVRGWTAGAGRGTRSRGSAIRTATSGSSRRRRTGDARPRPAFLERLDALADPVERAEVHALLPDPDGSAPGPTGSWASGWARCSRWPRSPTRCRSTSSSGCWRATSTRPAPARCGSCRARRRPRA